MQILMDSSYKFRVAPKLPQLTSAEVKLCLHWPWQRTSPLLEDWVKPTSSWDGLWNVFTNVWIAPGQSDIHKLRYPSGAVEPVQRRLKELLVSQLALSEQALASGVQLQTSQSLVHAVLAGSKESRSTALLWAPVGGFAKRRRLWDCPGGSVKEPIKTCRHFCKMCSSKGYPWQDDSSHCLPWQEGIYSRFWGYYRKPPKRRPYESFFNPIPSRHICGLTAWVFILTLNCCYPLQESCKISGFSFLLSNFYFLFSVFEW